ncbi:MAG: LacI family DNA-binding transcriptional regulator [Candidatus Marinimicrobia bacterium]|nr:LacI family DNA-binding transcriptional regulator [Candidatus Neomarinimicrobiota bacterium]
MKSKKQITLADIAKKLNVSKVTVSKALRNHSDISSEMKKKVQDLVDELGYTPNIIARNLSAKKTRTIGLVIPKINHHFFAEAIESIYTTAQKSNYEIIMTVSQENVDHEQKHIRSLLAMRVDGLLISVSENTTDTEIFKDLKKRHVPLVFFDRVIEGLGFNCITSDDEKGSYEIVKYAIEQGYRKIGHIGGYNNTNIGKARCEGYLRALKEAGIEPDPACLICGGFSVNDGYRGFMNFYNNKNLPQMIFAVTFPVALGIYRAVEELGLNIPRDIDVVSFGDASYNQFLNPSITGVHQPAAEIGKAALELLIDQIEEKEPIEEKKIVMPVKISLGQTCIKKEK